MPDYFSAFRHLSELLYFDVSMHDPLQRLYRTKLALLATILTAAGLGLLLAERWLRATGTMPWLQAWPLTDLGSALFTTGLVVVAFEYVDGQDSEERATARLHRVIQSEAPAIRDAVIDGFAFKQDDLARVATPETLDQIIRNSLALRLGDATFAEEIYTDIRDQAIRASERWHDAKIAIRLSMDRGSERAPRFVVTVRWDYTVVPRQATRRFAAVSDKDEYRELAQDPAATSAWYIRPTSGIEAGARESFELVQFSVDGEARPVRRSARKDGQVYSVNIGKDTVEAGQPVDISYTYRTLTSQRGHLLHFDIEQPTRGIDIELDYSDCGIGQISVLDFFASSKHTQISRTPDTVPGKSVSVHLDGWVFPRSGVAFVWALEDEGVRGAEPERHELGSNG